MEDVRQSLEALGRRDEEIVWLGLPQGAGRSGEYVARSRRTFAGVIAFTGGPIGPRGEDLTPPGELAGTSMLSTVSDADPLVPVHRVQETVGLFRDGGAHVELMVSRSLEREVTNDEIALGRSLLARVAPSPSLEGSAQRVERDVEVGARRRHVEGQ